MEDLNMLIIRLDKNHLEWIKKVKMNQSWKKLQRHVQLNWIVVCIHHLLPAALDRTVKEMVQPSFILNKATTIPQLILIIMKGDQFLQSAMLNTDFQETLIHIISEAIILPLTRSISWAARAWLSLTLENPYLTVDCLHQATTTSLRVIRLALQTNFSKISTHLHWM